MNAKVDNSLNLKSQKMKFKEYYCAGEIGIL